MFFFNRTRQLDIGDCDACQAAFWLLAACGADATDEELVAAYRACELRSIDLVQQPNNWRSIWRVAAELIAGCRALVWPAAERAVALHS
jgi:hypothetical protein